MPIPSAHTNRFAYHFTLLDNLPGIIQGGLLSPNEQARRAVRHRSIAEQSIQARRSRMHVTCGPQGVVHDYVPFYFTSLSPMLQAVINAKNVDQHDIVHLAVPATVLDRQDVVFSNAAANTVVPPQFYSDPAHLTQLNWEIIDSPSWRWSTTDKQKRMAEMLVHASVQHNEIAHIIVWNAHMKQQVETIYADAGVTPPRIVFTGHNRRYHYFTTFWDRAHNVSIVTGPKGIFSAYQAVLGFVTREGVNLNGRFANLWKMRDALRNSLSALPETAELIGLESENEMHHEDVGNHTLSVVRQLLASHEFAALSDNDQLLTEIAAYLHDIGKGPKSRWVAKGGKQQVDPDHPVRSIEQLARILTEEVATIKNRSVRVLTKLICYHDLVGDILGKGRNIEQLEQIAESPAELDMLIAIGLADMRSVNPRWADNHREDLVALRARVVARLNAATPEDED